MKECTFTPKINRTSKKNTPAINTICIDLKKKSKKKA